MPKQLKANRTGHDLGRLAPLCVWLILGLPAGYGCSSTSADQLAAPRVGQRSMDAGRRGIVDRDELLKIAQRYIGTPYKFGGASPAGFDCSGYTKYVFGQAGYQLPHGARYQFEKLDPVKKPAYGDLVFFKTYTPNVSHVGIYTGDERFLHSPSTGKTVSYASMTSSYWKTRYAGARTVVPGQPTPEKKEPTPVVNQELLDFEMLRTIYSGDSATFEKRMSEGASPDANYKGWSALMLTAYYGRTEMARALIAKKANVNFRTPQGWTAMSIARENKRTEIEKMLFAAGAVRTRAIGRPPVLPDPRSEQF